VRNASRSDVLSRSTGRGGDLFTIRMLQGTTISASALIVLVLTAVLLRRSAFCSVLLRTVDFSFRRAGSGSTADDIKIVQGWVAQLPEMDASTLIKLCARFEEELLDVHAVSTLTSAEFAELGIFKVRTSSALCNGI